MQEHPLLELYITIDDTKTSATVEQLLAKVDLDGVVLRTLHAVNITQPVMLTLLITDDNGIKEMNQQYRQQNKPTDVLSFPILEKPLVQAPSDLLWPPQEGDEISPIPEQSSTPAFVSPPSPVLNLGDVVISWPTVERQAATAGHPPLHELLYLLSHGVLHLVGYDDHSEAGYQEMVRIQNAVMAEINKKV